MVNLNSDMTYPFRNIFHNMMQTSATCVHDQFIDDLFFNMRAKYLKFFMTVPGTTSLNKRRLT